MNSKKIKSFLFENKTTLLFVFMAIFGIIASKQTLSFVLNELITRIGRNTFLVLALIIPIQAGMGLNFAIIIGAMAAQISLLVAVNFGMGGMTGFLLCVIISVPLSILFGFFTGNIFNKMKGSEMIGGLILGYFADGLYQFLFLFLFGTLIPIKNKNLLIPGGVGIKNTIDLKGSLRYVVDDVLRISLIDTITIAVILVIVINICILVFKNKKYSLLKTKKDSFFKTIDAKKIYAKIIAAIIIYLLTFIPVLEQLFLNAKIPVLTFAFIGLAYMFNKFFNFTRIGQNIRTVGQSMSVARSSGLNVNKLRIIAIIISTVLASWGQLILLQNMGTFQTYGAHTQVGIFAIASLLVGGASVDKASGKQAIIGIILFHTLFIVSPLAGKELFNDAQIGEYFRVFVSYGVIAVSLALHAWKSVVKNVVDEDSKEVTA